MSFVFLTDAGLRRLHQLESQAALGKKLNRRMTDELDDLRKNYELFFIRLNQRNDISGEEKVVLYREEVRRYEEARRLEWLDMTARENERRRKKARKARQREEKKDEMKINDIGGITSAPNSSPQLPAEPTQPKTHTCEESVGAPACRVPELTSACQEIGTASPCQEAEMAPSSQLSPLSLRPLREKNLAPLLAGCLS